MRRKYKSVNWIFIWEEYTIQQKKAIAKTIKWHRKRLIAIRWTKMVVQLQLPDYSEGISTILLSYSNRPIIFNRIVRQSDFRFRLPASDSSRIDQVSMLEIPIEKVVRTNWISAKLKIATFVVPYHTYTTAVPNSYQCWGCKPPFVARDNWSDNSCS